jgi:class 3 adenylate cyclase
MKPKSKSRLPSGYLTFMFTDMVFSSEIQERMSCELSSERAAKFLNLIKKPHDKIVLSRVNGRDGEIVKDTGDGFLVVFKDPEKAVFCGVEIQEHLKDAAIDTQTSRGKLQVRIGLSTGNAKLTNNDYIASVVNLASRVEKLCTPGQVYMSSETYGAVEGKLPSLSFRKLGLRKVEGFGKQRLYSVARLNQTESEVRSKTLAPKLNLVRGEGDEVLSRFDLAGDPSFRKPVVLLGDDDEERFEWFKKLLAEVYLTDAVRATTLEAVKKLARDLSERVTFRVVILADSLPLSGEFRKADPRINFSKLEEVEELYESDFCCLVTGNHKPNLKGLQRSPQIVHAPSMTGAEPRKANRERVLIELAKLRRIRPVRVLPDAEISDRVTALEKITVWDHSDGILRRQIRSLSELHDLDDGYEHLLHLLRDSISCESLAKMEIKALGQGMSGARVFRVIATRGKKPKEYVVKLRDTLAELETEVRGYHQARETTGVPGYKHHLPILGSPVSPLNALHPEQKFIAQYGSWFAIHYDFLGGNDLGKFIDMETVLIGAPADLKEKTRGTEYELASDGVTQLMKYRMKVFQTVLDGLSSLWYGKKVFSSRSKETIWKIQDAPEEEPAVRPPYQLTRLAKGRIQNFLDSEAARIGPRLFSKWKDHVKQVLILVNDTSTTANLGRLASSIPFTMSPIHGDLNSNNILLWLEHPKYPFIIDLPSYQKTGHCLQDFARLEVEIKLVLLDRQEESPIDPLAAYDYTLSQVPLWIELEDRLLAAHTFDKSKLTAARISPLKFKAEGYKNNVDLAYRLVMMLRQKACEIQQRKLDSGPEPTTFPNEYLPALLYQSVMAIGYSSLPVFKRLLAVYTAGSILSRLN